MVIKSKADRPWRYKGPRKGKKNSERYCIFSLIWCSLFACNLSDYSKVLGPGCTYVHEDSTQQFIFCSTKHDFLSGVPMGFHVGNQKLYPFEIFLRH